MIAARFLHCIQGSALLCSDKCRGRCSCRAGEEEPTAWEKAAHGRACHLELEACTAAGRRNVISVALCSHGSEPEAAVFIHMLAPSIPCMPSPVVVLNKQTNKQTNSLTLQKKEKKTYHDGDMNELRHAQIRYTQYRNLPKQKKNCYQALSFS
jgi:hypothetical protein